jgi:hypothetical protein
MSAVAIIPVMNEAAAIGELVRELLAGRFDGAVVVDGGSTDGTARRARDAGAELVLEPRRGYGRAVTSGVARARAHGATAITILDGNGSVRASEAARVLAPILRGDAELVIGCRDGAGLRALQRLGNRLAVEVIARTYGTRYADIGSVRAARLDAYDALELDELSYGWPLQLQVRAAARGLRIAQVPIALSPRQSPSKVSGTWRGRAGASTAFLRVLAAECVWSR